MSWLKALARLGNALYGVLGWGLEGVTLPRVSLSPVLGPGASSTISSIDRSSS